MRIESVIRVVNATPDGEFLMFEDATLIPIQLKLINKNMMTSSEVRIEKQFVLDLNTYIVLILHF